jgi:adenylate cyclase
MPAARERPGGSATGRFRVGVNSGRVMAGVLGGPTGHRTHGLVGDMVNLAARLESEASPGSVLVGSGTYKSLPDGSDADRLPPMNVKGKEEVVTAYVLHALPD